jgi:ATP-dependent Clp protease ATP-binding subunit ClpA
MSTQVHVTVAILERAVGEAHRRGENYLASEHLLIAVAPAKPLRARSVGVERLRAAVDRVIGVSNRIPGGSVPGTAMPGSDASAALRRAGGIAAASGRDAATDEDLLLALLDLPVEQNLVAAILHAEGLDVDEIRSELRNNGRDKLGF